MLPLPAQSEQVESSPSRMPYKDALHRDPSPILAKQGSFEYFILKDLHFLQAEFGVCILSVTPNVWLRGLL